MARPRTDIEPRIIAAARELFLAHGVEGTSLRQIARSADTSVGMIYYYFTTKDDLFLAVVEEDYGLILADMKEALADGAPGSFEERLGRLLRRVGQLSDHELQTIKLVIAEMLGSSDRRGRLLERFQRGHLPLILTFMTEGAAAGGLRSDLPAPLLMVSTFALGVLPQLLRRTLGAQLPFELPEGEELADLLHGVLMTGLAG